MSIIIKRSFQTKRIPNYDGYWSLILDKAKEATSIATTTTTITKKPLAVPITNTIEGPIKPKTPTKTVVYLKGKPIELPEKPSAPDNCCMR